MAPTPCASTSSKHNQSQHGHSKTPTSKHRLLFGASKSPNPNSLVKEIPPAEHPVEVIGRIRDFPDRKDKPISALQISPDLQTVRLRADFGYRDFSLDGISLSEEEDLEGFYNKFVSSRIQGVKLGYKCTVMMYGPTGSGKSHTMFGYSKLPGIVYRSLKDILGETSEEDEQQTFVQVTVLEIYNEEIYDLLSSNGGGGLGLACSKGNGSKARLEVIGKKAKNASSIVGSEAGKISKEIEKVEKRRTVKSTLCNERSSRSHCLIILDVPKVGGRLMLVDMAGSENIEQAGQAGLEAKLQTAKINQGNIALKRVVESIANGDSHVPFRDSKLTMLLQDSFEDDKSKILMILCASPDPKEIHKTISTLEYGAKAKCIIRGPETPNKEKIGLEDSSSFLNSRISAMDQFIRKLQIEKKQKERECIEAREQLSKKDEETAVLRAKIEGISGEWKGNEEEINLKVNERIRFLKSEMERKLNQCQKMASDFVELEKKRMEEKMMEQQQEVEILRKRLEEIESRLCGSGDDDVIGRRFLKRLLENEVDNDPRMVKSMDLDIGDDYDVKCEEEHDIFAAKYSNRVGLSTVYEEEEEEEEDKDEEYIDTTEVEEVKKEVIEEKRVCPNSQCSQRFTAKGEENGKENDVATPFRRKTLENIFTCCGNYRELSQINIPLPPKRSSSRSATKLFSDENLPPQTNVAPDSCGLVKMVGAPLPCYHPGQDWPKEVDQI